MSDLRYINIVQDKNKTLCQTHRADEPNDTSQGVVLVIPWRQVCTLFRRSSIGSLFVYIVIILRWRKGINELRRFIGIFGLCWTAVL